MFKISFFIKRKNEVGADDFREYWLGEHAELVAAYAEEIGVRQYLKCEILPDHPMTIEGSRA